jgi:hypothetical protein
MSSFSDEIEAALENFEKTIRRIADRARLMVLAPWCNQHRVRFYSGMGAYNLEGVDEPHASLSDWETYQEWEKQAPDEIGEDLAQHKPPEGWTRLREILELTVWGDTCLADYMDDYDPGELA